MIQDYIMDIALSGKQNNDNWSQERLGKFTSSEIHRLIGIGKKQSLTEKAQTYILEKAAEIITGWWDEPYSPALAHGHEYEAVAKEKLIEQGINVIECGFIVSFDYDNFGGSPDGIIDNNTILEIKCPYNPANHLNTLITGYIKDEYYYQMQSNMLITGAEKCLFVTYDPRYKADKEMYTKIIERDEMAQNEIIKKLTEANNYLSELLSCFDN